MPPRAARRLPTVSALKKRPPPPDDSPTRRPSDAPREPSPLPKEEKERMEFVPREADRAERLELEDSDRQFETYMEGRGNIRGEEHHPELEGGEEDGVRTDGDDMMEDMVVVEEEVEVEEEEEVGEEDVRREHDEGDGYAEEHHHVVKERRKRKEFEVFVGGLDRDVTEEDLTKVFSRVGDITEVRLMMNPMTQKNKGFAFVRFATIDQAKRAIHEIRHPVINGKQCGVAPSQDSDTLFVGNICRTWTKDILKERLAYYGIDDYEDLILVGDARNEGMNRGFAFLDFSCRAAALEACKRLHKIDAVFGTDRTARVAFADTFIEPDDEIMSHVRTIFLDGLPPTWDEDHVYDHLKKFGEIEKVELARNMHAAKRNDFGFVTFDTHDAAVACVSGVNNDELDDGDHKIKVRARLSRPRQRGKLAKHARGGYLVGRGGGWDGKTSSHMESRRIMDHSGGSIHSHSGYDGELRRSYGSRERDDISYRRRYSSPEKSYARRSPVSAYGKTSSKRDYIRHDEILPRSSDSERRSYRDTYPSRGVEYLENSPRSVSRAAARRYSPHYDDYSYDRYIERPYRDNQGREYISISGSKRSHSAVEEAHPRYAESSIRQSRTRYDYGGSSYSVPYSDSSYGSGSTRPGRSSRVEYHEAGRSSAGHSQGLYDTRTSTMGYRRDEIRRGDEERMYSISSYDRDYVSRDYVSSRSDMGAGSYPPDYPSRRLNDEYLSRESDSYY